MSKFIQRFWRESRVVRKFRNDRVALFSLFIISVFATIFVVTALTPLNTDYVNLQQRKFNEFNENKQTLKNTLFKNERLQKTLSGLLGKVASLGSKANVATKHNQAKPKSKSSKSGVTKKTDTRVIATSNPTKKASAQASEVRELALKMKATLAAQSQKIRQQLSAMKAYASLMKRQQRLLKKQQQTLRIQEQKIQLLRKVAVLQKQSVELQTQILMLKIKMREKAPSKLNWMQRYNQDTGQAFAKPVWLGANEEERTIIQAITPYVLVNSDWVKEAILHHKRRGFLGSDRLGRDIFKRTVVSVNVAFKIGLVTAFIACLLGLVLGGMAGFFGGWIDLVITWVYSVFSSIPYIVLVLLIAAIFRDMPGLFGLYVAFGLTFWIGPARVVRGEVMKIKQMEYVQAARALGNSRLRILFRHVLPNTMHLIFVYFSLIFIGAIKSEVILTFLGLGVKGMPSWGAMISDASKEIIGGFWWQMIGASVALFLLVYAFNIFTDALQDALDPKHIK